MSKELEALERMGCATLEEDLSVRDIYENEYDIVKNALQRLEAIYNANPSEALECLEKLKGMEISSMPFSDEYGTQEVDLNDIRKVGSQLNTDFREYTTTIKQALLKAQEQNSTNIFKGSKKFKIEIPESSLMDYNPVKNYLKWEDLDFKEKRQEIPVRMGETTYTLVLRKTDGGNKIAKLLSPKRNYMGEWGDIFYEEAKQFFNDLRLEMVE